MKLLERLLFLQGNRCFFCHEPIPQGEASVEHLVASANGGGKDFENCVVCCKSLNEALGHLSIKAKLRAVLDQRGPFVCPRHMEGAALETLSQLGQADLAHRLTLAVAALQKQKKSRPRRIASLRKFIASAFQNKLSADDVDAIVSALKSAGHVSVEGAKLVYAFGEGE
jgi:hypothetical protein